VIFIQHSTFNGNGKIIASQAFRAVYMHNCVLYRYLEPLNSVAIEQANHIHTLQSRRRSIWQSQRQSLCCIRL